MSFLLVSGKQYHCSTCGAKHLVEFEGGPQYTQIGDFAVMDEKQLAQEYGQPNANPDEEGYYLYDFITCAACRANQVKDDPEKADAAIELIRMIGLASMERDQRLREIAASFIQSLNPITDETWRELLGEEAFQELNDSTLLPAKKQHKLDTLLVNTCLARDFLQSRLKAMKKELQAEPKPWANPIYEYAESHDLKGRMKLLYPRATWSSENLNQYIQTSFTVRHPVETSPHVLVYDEYKIDITSRLGEMRSLTYVGVFEMLGPDVFDPPVMKQAVSRFIGDLKT